MFKKLKSYSLKSSYRKKTFFALIAASLIPMFFLSLIIFSQIATLYQQNKEDMLNKTFDQIEKNFDIKVSAINNSMNTLIFNTGLSNFMDSEITEEPDNYTLFNQFVFFRDIFDPSVNNILNSNLYIQNVYFHTSRPDLYVRHTILPLENSDTPTWIKNYHFKEKPTWLYHNGSFDVLSAFPNGVKHPTVIQIRISSEEFFKDLVTNDQQFAYSVTNSEGQKVFSTPNINNKDLQLADKRQLSSNGWEIDFYIANAALRNFALKSFSGIILFFFLCIIISLIVTNLLSRQVIKPLGILKNKVASVTEDNFTVDFTSEQHDEVGELSNLIGDLMMRIQTLIKTNYETTIEKQKNEYQALTSQINSHFLYNTLSAMNWQAMMAGQDELSTAIQTLSKYYRTTLNKGKTRISLEGEIENVITYINLQHFLNPNRFSVEYDFGPDLQQITVINLMLQPIVENAIEHGFKNKVTDAKIKLSVHKNKSDQLILAVSDNGDGMSPETIHKILTSESSGYGLRNINQRIKFYFGEEYGLNITSTLGKGTTVTIVLPITE